MHTLLSLFFSMLTPRFAEIAPISYTMASFRMLFANIYNYAVRSDALGGLSCQFVEPLNSVQECSEQLF
jgi:hypothetical protein